MTRIAKPCTEPTFCRSCKRPIFWVLTHMDKRMPVDAKPVANGNLVLTHDKHANILRSEPYRVGEPLHQLVDTLTGKMPRNRYISHFATCPESASHRKPKSSEPT